MKIKGISHLTGLAILCLIVSCKKSSTTPNTPSGSNLVRIQEGIDPDITNDTVYLVRYNSSGQITSINDSLNVDSLTASYDANNNLTNWHDLYGISTSFSYNGNQLTQIDQELAGSHEQFVFTYTNNILSKMNYNSDLGSGGSVSPYGYFLITMTGGNITEEKGYTNGGVLQEDITFTYGSQANFFQKLSLFDVGGTLGSDDIFNQLTWFNKNLVTGFSQGGMTATSTYTFNSSGQPTHVVTHDPINVGVFTWQFSYK
jgi:hypothetical protein